MMNDTSTAAPAGKLLLLFHLSAWLLVFGISWGAFARMMPMTENLLRSVGNTGLMALLFYGVGEAYQRYYERKAYGLFALSVTILFLVVTTSRYLLNQQFAYQEGATPYYIPGPISFFVGAVITNLAILFNSLFYQLVRSRVEMKQRQTELVAEQRDASIQFLRAQMNPHFLFNTLNNIYSLAVVRSEKTAPLVLRLSELLRYVIYDTQAEQVPLGKEIKLLEEYIELQQLQYEQLRNIDFSCQLSQRGLYLKPLLLIPLVENCFKHSDLTENEQAYVRLTLKANKEELVFTTENTFNPEQTQKDRQGGVGLENIRKRLSLEYPDHHRFEEKIAGNCFWVTLKIIFNNESLS